MKVSLLPSATAVLIMGDSQNLTTGPAADLRRSYVKLDLTMNNTNGSKERISCVRQPTQHYHHQVREPLVCVCVCSANVFVVLNTNSSCVQTSDEIHKLHVHQDST